MFSEPSVTIQERTRLFGYKGAAVTNTVVGMGRAKKNGGGKGRPPSREKLTYTAIPKEYGELLKGLTEDGEEYEGRSVMFLTKLAVRAFLQGKGKLDAKGKPLQ